MQIEVEVFENLNQSDFHSKSGFVFLSRKDSSDAKEAKERKDYKYLGTTVIDIKEPKRKKLVYQWLWQTVYGYFKTTESYYGVNDKNIVRDQLQHVLKEGGILRPIMESEKEIDV